ncbi:MAG: phytoene/squalene synthase family protein [Tepidisphaeraceae bacterium]
MTPDADFAAARDICRRHAKSFYFASHFLPREKRLHAYAVYAFCRLLDDAVDEASDNATRVARLVKFDELLDSLYAGDLPDEPIEQDKALRAFAATVNACEIPKRLFQELAEGCRMDLTNNIYADWPALETYCYHVAGVVGVIMCHVFGLADPAAHRKAIAMGNAMQVTNILRDIKEDLAMNRIYLPQDELARFGVTEAGLRAGRVTTEFVELMRFEIARARALYAEGADGLRLIPNDGSRYTAAVMSSVYGGILGAIERQNYDVFSRRARLNGVQKIKKLFVARRLVK